MPSRKIKTKKINRKDEKIESLWMLKLFVVKRILC